MQASHCRPVPGRKPHLNGVIHGVRPLAHYACSTAEGHVANPAAESASWLRTNVHTSTATAIRRRRLVDLLLPARLQAIHPLLHLDQALFELIHARGEAWAAAYSGIPAVRRRVSS